MNVLIIEDEQELLDSIRDYLSDDEINCETAINFQLGMEKVGALNVYDCIILDLNLPDGSGYDILKKVKELNSKQPVIIISADNSIIAVPTALKFGADDYLIKPFYLAELKARMINAIFLKGENDDHTLIFREIIINLQTKEVWIMRNPLFLDTREYELMLFFVENHEKCITKSAIGTFIWGDEKPGYPVIDGIILKLKEKLMDAGCPDYIHQMYGIAYKFSQMK